MSYYVSRWPDQCDPRDGYMGHEVLNGIQTPPARIFFLDDPPGTPVSNWTYNGPLGALFPLPELLVNMFTPGCEPRNVIWLEGFIIAFPAGPTLVVVQIIKFERSIATVDPWDSYYIRLSINSVPSDNLVEYRVTIEDDYSIYQNNTPGLSWIWTFEGTPFQVVTNTAAYPCAFNRTLPGPPFPGNPPP